MTHRELDAAVYRKVDEVPRGVFPAGALRPRAQRTRVSPAPWTTA